MPLYLLVKAFVVVVSLGYNLRDIVYFDRPGIGF